MSSSKTGAISKSSPVSKDQDLQGLVQEQKNQKDPTNLAKTIAEQLDDVQGAFHDGLGLKDAIEETAKVHANMKTKSNKTNKNIL